MHTFLYSLVPSTFDNDPVYVPRRTSMFVREGNVYVSTCGSFFIDQLLPLLI